MMEMTDVIPDLEDRAWPSGGFRPQWCFPGGLAIPVGSVRCAPVASHGPGPLFAASFTGRETASAPDACAFPTSPKLCDAPGGSGWRRFGHKMESRV